MYVISRIVTTGLDQTLSALLTKSTSAFWIKLDFVAELLLIVAKEYYMLQQNIILLAIIDKNVAIRLSSFQYFGSFHSICPVIEIMHLAM